MGTRGGWEQLVALDRRAAELARGIGATLVQLGEALGALAERGAHLELGFSSLGAYVQERCGRSASWARDVVRVARDLGRWRALRRCVLSGEVTWSAAEVVLRALRASSSAEAVLAPGVLEEAERAWIARAQVLTVRELRAAVRDVESGAPSSFGDDTVPPTESATAPEAAHARSEDGSASAAPHANRPAAIAATHPYLRRLPTHVLTMTMDAERAWWFECARQVYERSVSDCGGRARSTENFLLALLAEARTELEAGEVASTETLERWGHYLQQRAAWREESERRCDATRQALHLALHTDGLKCGDVGGEPDVRQRGPTTSTALDGRALDGRARDLMKSLVRRDLELGRLAVWLQKAEAWLHLGFASESHYVRERMGLGFSQWKLKRSIARKLGEFPALEAALWHGEVGLEAAALLLRIKTERDVIERQWLERARARTFKHLREEVQAAELAAQQWGVPALPPSEETMRRLLALQGRVKSGAVLTEAVLTEAVLTEDSDGSARIAQRAWLDLRGELREIFRGAFLPDLGEPDVRREPGACRKGQIRLRLRLERDTLVEYRCLERLFRRQHPGDFFEFLCRHFLAVWAPTTLTDVKYAHIYRRDAFKCSSPVCERHDVQPHHLKFRSAGGGEDDENLTSLCTWCHLEGVHGGRIRVAPPASRMRWDLGRSFIEVHGREVLFTSAARDDRRGARGGCDRGAP